MLLICGQSIKYFSSFSLQRICPIVELTKLAICWVRFTVIQISNLTSLILQEILGDTRLKAHLFALSRYVAIM